MKNPDISVVMPVYNGEKYLKEAIESVLNQSYKNFEFIIINDGSTDSTEAIILEYNDSRIRYIRQENTGIGGALRNGCNLAIGNYIARMDADDICLTNRFELQKKYLDLNPTIVLVSNAVIYIDEFGNSLGRSFPYTSNSAIKKKFKLGSPICHPSVMMRKNAYVSSGGYKDLEPLEDLYLWIKLSKQGKLHNLSSPLLKYRILNNSISRSISKKRYNQIIKYLIYNVNCLSENNILELNGMYQKAKIEAKENDLYNNSSDTFISNSNLEFNIYQKLRRVKLPESSIEIIICKLKNMLTYF